MSLWIMYYLRKNASKPVGDLDHEDQLVFKDLSKNPFGRHLSARVPHKHNSKSQVKFI